MCAAPRPSLALLAFCLARVRQNHGSSHRHCNAPRCLWSCWPCRTAVQEGEQCSMLTLRNEMQAVPLHRQPGEHVTRRPQENQAAGGLRAMAGGRQAHAATATRIGWSCRFLAWPSLAVSAHIGTADWPAKRCAVRMGAVSMPALP